MQENLIGIQDTVLNQFLSKNESQFLVTLNKKILKINIDLSKLEVEKEKIIKKIVSENTADNPRFKREYANNSETALESVNIISKNLYELSNNYNTINQLNNFIVKKCDENFAGYNFKADISKLVEKIKLVEELEVKLEEDNKKNYLIVESFLNDEAIEVEDINYNDNNKVSDNLSFKDINVDNIKDNMVLKICEKRVELPYTKKEVFEFMKEYPNDYKTPQDVISREFIIQMSLFKKHPILSRFKETYYLCRTKEMMSIFDSFSYAKNIMFRSDINPYIIAAVKSVKQLESYIDCLENNKLDCYKYFDIVYEINPIANNKICY